ncbi:(3,5-dihydroxycyclohex-3-enyl)acetyl-CoA dehydratase subunit B [Streptomyces sp. 1114.5]|uniref:enoyl-CoA-hydratase DpgB n=1 Tax=unclassified Streptomyces TaxID=2593676 RepID=UPI000BDB98D7|nr:MULTISPECIES: enoyl-CoA-hydratase DpgB [unclassified Streptomyces]RKT19027.1 (3,5-dihydroxycyclohex-3-enyl)acetyl-CoA dehydratase subunit B [Streptomyces sp. 1114.5]SOB85228.1 (3,5-dihydroxycyclohex-3-enyl)acetyl-CoA dehydratase subunit B [Streptomyces sp. 1331.2]
MDDATATDVVTLAIDGTQPLSAASVAAVAQACDRVQHGPGARLVLRVAGTPGPGWTDGLTVGLVSKWERGLRLLERLPALTVAVADGDCGGTALDALLAADYRIATTTARLVMPVTTGGASGTWPGMALYRLARQGAGVATVRRALLFGEPIDAFRARSVQLVDEVSDDVPGALSAALGRLGASTGTPAGRLCGAELAIRRQLMFDAGTVSFEEALGVHLAACDRVLRRTADGGTA